MYLCVCVCAVCVFPEVFQRKPLYNGAPPSNSEIENVSIDVFHYLFCRCFYSNQTLGKSKNQDNRVYINVSACEYYRELKRAKSKVINRTEQDGFVLTQTNVRSFTWIYGVRTEAGLLTHFHIFNILGSTHSIFLLMVAFFPAAHCTDVCVLDYVYLC